MASADAIRNELRELGVERAKLDDDDAELMKRVTKALARAKGKVPVTEAADLLQMHRTTIYRVYRPNGNGHG